MTKSPTTVPAGSMMTDAVEIMAERKISELPVVDAAGRPAGLIDITDLVALFPEGTLAAEFAQPSRSSGPPAPKNPAWVRTPLRPGLSETLGKNDE